MRWRPPGPPKGLTPPARIPLERVEFFKIPTLDVNGLIAAIERCVIDRGLVTRVVHADGHVFEIIRNNFAFLVRKSSGKPIGTARTVERALDLAEVFFGTHPEDDPLDAVFRLNREWQRIDADELSALQAAD